MICPHCKHSRSSVIDSRHQPNGMISRRRECTDCHGRYSTFEVHSAELIRLRSLAGLAEDHARGARVILGGDS